MGYSKKEFSQRLASVGIITTIAIGSVLLTTACSKPADAPTSNSQQSVAPKAETKENLELLKKVKALLDGEKYDQAKTVVEKMLANDANSANAHHCLAYIYHQTEKLDKAIDEYTRALEINPQEADSWHARGNSYLKKKLYEKAAIDFSKALMIHPAHYTWYLRSCAYLEQGLYEKAIADANQSIALNSNYAPAYLTKVSAERKLGLESEAATDLAQAKSLKLTDGYQLSIREEFLSEDADLEAAVTDCTAIIKLFPMSSDWHYTRARCYLDLEKVKEARADFDLANKYDPKNDWYDDWAATVNNIEYDLSHRAKTPAQQWAIACSSMLFATNGQGLHSLSGRAFTEENKRSKQIALEEVWGVSSRVDLLTALQNLKNNGGHNYLWQTYIKIKKGEIKPGDVKEVAEDILSGEFKERLAVVSEYGDTFGDRGISAWDLCRYVNLVRGGYLLGLVSEKEAYDLIMPVAMKIQQTYSSWEQMNDEYLIGRKFWSHKEWQEDTLKTTRITKRLLTQKSSPWVALPWDTDLNCNTKIESSN
ncbi:hypothetical protein BH11CYA1_BH11CYA1_50550 [soil metagenome]